MAFAIRNLSVLAHANGFTLWHYKEKNRPIVIVGQDDFFVAAHDMLMVGDLIIVNAINGTCIMCVRQSSVHTVTTEPLS